MAWCLIDPVEQDSVVALQKSKLLLRICYSGIVSNPAIMHRLMPSIITVRVTSTSMDGHRISMTHS